MKLKWSPLVASASGKAADAVCASWKGIQYVRMHVIPHNPKTDAQVAVRDSLGRCVTLWRSLAVLIKLWLDTYAVDYRMSGYNLFIQKCRALEQAAGLLVPVPPNPYAPAPDTFAAVTGIGIAGDIDVSWVDNSTYPDARLYLVVRLANTDIFSAAGVPMANLEAFTIPDLDAGGVYDVYGWFRHGTTGECSTSDGDQAVAAKA